LNYVFGKTATSHVASIVANKCFFMSFLCRSVSESEPLLWYWKHTPSRALWTAHLTMSMWEMADLGGTM